jgi:hypothetical protein
MGFKVRGYTRDVPEDKVRDYSLFAIACEVTVTEPEYFKPFNGIDRIKVDIIEPALPEDGVGLSPSKVLDRVKAYISENQLSAEDGDSLWCVIECIEIWLLYHKLNDLRGLGIETVKDAKQALDKVGKYYWVKYLPLMLDAIENASKADKHPDGYMPELLETKVYLLGRALYERMGKVRFEKFVALLPQVEKEMLERKKREQKR